MKKVQILAFTFGLLTLGACSESFLDSEPKDVITESNFYKTIDDAQDALTGCYDGYQRVWSDGVALPIAAEVMSDNTYGATGNSDDFKYQMIDEFDQDRAPSVNSVFDANWKAYYKAIFRMNTLLLKLDQIDWSKDANARKQIEGETRFLRALCYFDMVRLWGNIPLLTVPTDEILPQAAPEDVYKVIAEDLKFAADNLDATPYAAIAVEKYGHANKYAAEAILARVFLYYTGYYSKTDLAGIVTKDQVVTYLSDVIANGGYGLVEHFAQLWPAASVNGFIGEDNKETIFAVKYTYTSDYNGNVDGNHWMVMNGLREQSWTPYGLGWGACTVSPKLYAAYANNDTRKVASIISIEGENIAFEKIEKQREYTGFYTKKYTPMVDDESNSLAVKLGGVNFMIGQFQDYVVIRYADVLLMAAELGIDAQTNFDLVRNRAFGGNAPAKLVSQQAIMDERRLEFAFEGIRYWDLLRTTQGNPSTIINETLTVLNGGTEATKTITFNTQTKGLSQIPENQITLSGNVWVQNEGWK